MMHLGSGSLNKENRLQILLLLPKSIAEPEKQRKVQQCCKNKTEKKLVETSSGKAHPSASKENLVGFQATPHIKLIYEVSKVVAHISFATEFYILDIPARKWYTHNWEKYRNFEAIAPLLCWENHFTFLSVERAGIVYQT